METATALFFIKRTWEEGRTDYLGPYLEHQHFSLAMQRGADHRRRHRIIRWEWVQGKDT